MTKKASRKIPKTVRIGKVSSINYDEGLIRVTYPEMDDLVTGEFPVFNFNGEYKMPKIGAQVIVLHLSNGTTAGVVLGTMWSSASSSKLTGKGVFRKELGLTAGEAYISYDGEDITFHSPAGTATLSDLIG